MKPSVASASLAIACCISLCCHQPAHADAGDLFPDSKATSRFAAQKQALVGAQQQAAQKAAPPAVKRIPIAARKAPPKPAAGESTDAQVVAAMKRGIEFVLKQKKADNWEGKIGAEARWQSGETALALYALLTARESLVDEAALREKLDPRGAELQPVVKWLAGCAVQGTYPAGYKAAALSLAAGEGDPQEKAAMQKALSVCKDYLALAIGPDGGYTYVKGAVAAVDYERQIAAARKAYDAALQKVQAGQVDPLTKKKVPYTSEEAAKILDASKSRLTAAERRFNPIGDLSNARCATMGAAAMANAGVDIPRVYWEVTDRFWRQTQLADGSWGYLPFDKEGRCPMTVGAVASLLTAQSFIPVEPSAGAALDKTLGSAFAWLNKAAAENKFPWNNWYLLHSLVVIGRQSGERNLGAGNWYQSGVNSILRAQHPDGSVPGPQGPVVSTAMALLFLAEGRSPILFNKLDYGAGWNRNRRDALNAAAAVGRSVDRPMAWQVVNFKMPLEDWTDAPLLLVAGIADPTFSPEELAKLREFIAAGGTIFSTADSGSATFTNAIRKYAAAVMEKKAEFRPLPKEHKLFENSPALAAPGGTALWGMTDGTREVWIHAAGDVGSDWQASRAGRGVDLAKALYACVKDSGLLRPRLGVVKDAAR